MYSGGSISGYSLLSRIKDWEELLSGLRVSQIIDCLIYEINYGNRYDFILYNSDKNILKIMPYGLSERRVAMALNLKIGNYYYLVKRDESIFDESIPIENRINLDVFDCLIASRVFLPGGEKYGLLGKAEKIRNEQDLYLDLETKMTISNYVATEYNSKSKESSVMICGTLELLGATERLIDALTDSKNIIKMECSNFISTDKNATAKLTASLRK